MAKTARGESKQQPDSADANEPSESVMPGPTEEEIAVRAYYIYLERGDADGDATDDWLQAERELSDGKVITVAE